MNEKPPAGTAGSGLARARDGTPHRLRDVQAEDLPAIQALFDQLSPRSRYQRFLSGSGGSVSYTSRLTDAERTLDAVVVTSGPEIVAVGSTHRLRSDCAELALAIAERHQGLGLGPLVVEELVTRSRGRGLRSLIGEPLLANGQMMDVLRHLGLPFSVSVDAGTAAVSVDLRDGEEFRRAVAHRAGEARRASLDPLLRPRSVVVLHGSSDGSVVGGAPIQVASGPHVTRLRRRRTSPEAAPDITGGLGDITDPPDLAVVDVPSPRLLGAVSACLRQGVRAIVVTATVPEATWITERLRLACLRGGVRLLGPGAEVLVNTDREVGLRIMRSRGQLRPGSVAVVGDDALRVRRVVRRLARRGVGVSVVVDVDGSVDVDVADVVAWAATDPGTGVVLVHTGSPQTTQVAAALEVLDRPTSPVVVTDGSPPPASTPGVIQAFTLDEMVNLAMLLTTQSAPSGRHVAMVTNDSWRSHDAVNRRLASAQLYGPDLTQHAEQRSKLLCPGIELHSAVIALPGDATAGAFGGVLETLASEAGVDAVVLAATLPRRRERDELDRVVRTVRQDQPDVVIIEVDPDHLRDAGGPVPVFDSDGRAVDVLTSLMHA
jgi:GNAT superfamily N-acetyltransferase